MSFVLYGTSPVCNIWHKNPSRKLEVKFIVPWHEFFYKMYMDRLQLLFMQYVANCTLKEAYIIQQVTQWVLVDRYSCAALTLPLQSVHCICHGQPAGGMNSPVSLRLQYVDAKACSVCCPWSRYQCWYSPDGVLVFSLQKPMMKYILSYYVLVNFAVLFCY